LNRGGFVNGIIVINKHPGLTSTKVVEKVKRLLHAKKAGHLGTLDPMAKGVLPICLGKATKLAPFLMDKEKEYLSTIKLGITTTTHDKEGEVLEEKEVPPIAREEVEKILPRFTGEIEQIPPMYSAARYKGKRLYQLARKGEVVERAPKKVEVHELSCLELDPPFIKIFIRCGKGVYIRQLACDIGQLLKCGGALWDLVRTKACGFTLDEAVTLEELQEMTSEERQKLVIPLAQAVKDAPTISLAGKLRWWVAMGNALVITPQELGLKTEEIREGMLVRLIDQEGELVALGETVRSLEGHWLCQPRRVFYAS
jgi:tRNA pseudouridine55 synthase